MLDMDWSISDEALRALTYVFARVGRCPRCKGICMADDNGVVSPDGVVEAFEGVCFADGCGEFRISHHGVDFCPLGGEPV